MKLTPPAPARPRRLPHYPGLAAVFLSICCLAVTRADESVYDPWFDESYGDKPGAEEEESVALPTRKSPKSLYRVAMASYERIPQDNLSKRISALEAAVNIHPEGSAEARATLAALKEQRLQVLAALAAANRGSSSLLEAIRVLQPHASVFQADTSLLFKLLESDFSEALDRQIRHLGDERQFQELAALGQAVESSGLGPALGQRFERHYHGALGHIIASKWVAEADSLLPGEAFLMGRLLQEPTRKMTLKVEFAPGAPELLSRNLLRSFERRWGKDFDIVMNEGDQPADFVLSIASTPIDAERRISESTVASTIAGHTSEEPNPEFMAKAAEYEKAASRYEVAMRTYEASYERYIEQSYDEDYENAQRDLRQAEHTYRVVQATSGGMPTPELAAAKAGRDTAQALANSVSPQSFPEPIKPRATHLEILQELYLIPSTIVTSQESTPYEFTRQHLEYRFSAQAELALRASALPLAEARAPVSLQQERDWVRNEGVHPRDPTADGGDFSEEALESALSLFSLEFGSSCSQAFASLLGEAEAALAAPADHLPDARRLTLGLALDLQKDEASRVALSPVEIGQLADLAQSSELTPTAFRAHCLSLVASRSGAPDAPTAEQIAALLR